MAKSAGVFHLVTVMIGESYADVNPSQSKLLFIYHAELVYFYSLSHPSGAGVLSLPSSFALLGWALGPTLLLIFGAATVWWVSISLLFKGGTIGSST